MKKTVAVMAILTALGATAWAASQYTVQQYVLIDRTGSLTAADRARIGELAVPYLGVNISSDVVERVEDASEAYLDSVYGKDVYDVDAAKTVSNGNMELYVQYDKGLPVTKPQPAVPHVAGGGVVFQLTDYTKELPQADRAELANILNQYTAGAARGELADRAEDSVEHYLDTKYGADVYDVDLVLLTDKSYDVRIKADKNYAARGIPVQEKVVPQADTMGSTAVVLQLTDYTQALPAEDRARITTILNRYTHGASADQLADWAEDAVEEYLENKYGDDVYKVERVRLSGAAYDIRIMRDK